MDDNKLTTTMNTVLYINKYARRLQHRQYIRTFKQNIITIILCSCVCVCVVVCWRTRVCQLQDHNHIYVACVCALCVCCCCACTVVGMRMYTHEGIRI